MIWLFQKKNNQENSSSSKEESPTEEARKLNIPPSVGSGKRTEKQPFLRPIKIYKPPHGVLPEGIRRERLAMDKAIFDRVDRSVMDTTNLSSYGYGGFPGYPYLSQLSQIVEYRNASKIYSEEMTRKFINLKYKDEGGNQKKIHELNQDIERFKVRDVFRHAALHDGYFGQALVYIDVLSPSGVSAWKDDDELQTPLIIDNVKIPKGALQRFKLIEPIWAYPGVYNADDPLAPDWYKPDLWYIMGRTLHTSRILSMQLNPVPDILKAAYNFGGISRSQLIETYVQNWLRTRDSVSDIVHSFVLQGIKTSMSQVLFNSGGGDLYSGDIEQLRRRSALFSEMRDSRGLMLMDKDNEDFFQHTVPLNNLDNIQSQSLEQICAASLIPLVKFTGITPSGLNASSEGEIRVFYDTVRSFQESLYRDALEKAIDILQINRYGEIDPDISFDFIPLYELNEEQRAKLEFERARADTLYAESGILTPQQIRDKVINDQQSSYQEEDDASYKDILRQRNKT